MSEDPDKSIREQLLRLLYIEMGGWELLAQQQKRRHQLGIRFFILIALIEVISAVMGMLEHAQATTPVWALLQWVGVRPWTPLVLENFGGKSIFSMVSVFCAAVITAMTALKFGKWWIPARSYRNELWILAMKFRAGLLTDEGFLRLRRTLAERYEAGSLEGAPNQTWPPPAAKGKSAEKTDEAPTLLLPPSTSWLKNDNGFHSLSFDDMVTQLKGFLGYNEGEVRKIYRQNLIYTCLPILMGILTSILFFLEIFELAWVTGHLSVMIVSHQSRLRLGEQLANKRASLIAVKDALFRAEVLRGKVDYGTDGWERFAGGTIDIFASEFRSWSGTMGGMVDAVWAAHERDRVEDAATDRQAAVLKLVSGGATASKADDKK